MNMNNNQLDSMRKDAEMLLKWDNPILNRLGEKLELLLDKMDSMEKENVRLRHLDAVNKKEKAYEKAKKIDAQRQ